MQIKLRSVDALVFAVAMFAVVGFVVYGITQGLCIAPGILFMVLFGVIGIVAAKDAFTFIFPPKDKTLLTNPLDDDNETS